jgi:hypothetical protein
MAVGSAGPVFAPGRIAHGSWMPLVFGAIMLAALSFTVPAQAQDATDHDPTYELMGSIAHLDSATGEIRIGQERFRLAPNLVIRDLPDGQSLRRGLNVGYVVQYGAAGDIPLVTHLWVIE